MELAFIPVPEQLITCNCCLTDPQRLVVSLTVRVLHCMPCRVSATTVVIQMRCPLSLTAPSSWPCVLWRT